MTFPAPSQNACRVWIPPTDKGYRCRACGRAREYHSGGALNRELITELEAIWEREIAARKSPWDAAMVLVEHALARNGKPSRKRPVRKGGLSPNQAALLEFIRRTFQATDGEMAVTDRQIRMARVIPSRSLTTTRASLVGKGLIRPVAVGVAAWVPVE